MSGQEWLILYPIYVFTFCEPKNKHLNAVEEMIKYLRTEIHLYCEKVPF